MDSTGTTIIVVAAFMLGALLGSWTRTNTTRYEAIKANCGYYEASTGEFKFGRQ